MRASQFQRVLDPFLVIEIFLEMGAMVLVFARLLEMVCSFHQLSCSYVAFEVNKTWRVWDDGGSGGGGGEYDGGGSDSGVQNRALAQS